MVKRGGKTNKKNSMKKKIVISNTPQKLPVMSTILYTFLMYHFNVDAIWWGVFITLEVIIWVICIIAVCNQESVDIFDSKTTASKGKFAEKLEEIIKQNKSK